jgi:hypothetical protein
MGCLLRKKLFVDALELLFHALDLPPCGFALLGIQLQGRIVGEPRMDAV